MRVHAFTAISQNSVAIFKKVYNLLVATPDIQIVGAPPGDIEAVVSCHSLSRAVARLFPELELMDGNYQEDFSHSWLIARGRDVIDVYPVGTLTNANGVIAPLLVESAVAYGLYNPEKLSHVEELLRRPWFGPSVDQIEAKLREVALALPPE